MKSTGEMYKKTVLRRLCKLIDLSFDNIEQARAYDDGGDVTFENTPELSGSNRAAIEAKERPVNVFDQNAKEKDPVPVVDGMAIEEA